MDSDSASIHSSRTMFSGSQKEKIIPNLKLEEMMDEYRKKCDRMMKEYRENLKQEYEKKYTNLTLTLRKIFRDEVTFMSETVRSYRFEN